MKKRISKKVASEKYGVLTRGVNSLYRYYLLDDGRVIDSAGDVRFQPKGYDLDEKCYSCGKIPDMFGRCNCCNADAY